MKFQSSIQNKVKFGYYICLALIVIVSIINYVDLRRIDKKITFSFVITELFDTTLEMRRFEKNYFLYSDKEDYSENLQFTEKAQEIIQKNKEAIRKLAIRADVHDLDAELTGYKSLMRRYYALDKLLNPVEAYTLEGKIRVSGKKIVNISEKISTAEKEYIQTLITSSNKILLASIVFLIVAGCIIGQYLSRVVVRPLKQLEVCMRDIAEGKFNTISCDSSEMEILSFERAFSTMIKELEHRQIKVISQSEKLASLGTMVSGVAHQLNNPLSNISTSCQILQEEIEESDMAYKKELLEQIEGQVERAKNMVHSLLEFSRAKEFKGSALPLKELVEETIRLLKGDIPSKIDVLVNMPEDVWIIADKQRMQHALLNIIKNGIDATPDEGVICISANEDLENKTIEIRIQDTGMGIEPEHLEKIFTPFFTTKADGKGSGLGLFVAREIIKEHNGVIEVNSAVGEGTAFTIKLPLKEI